MKERKSVNKEQERVCGKIKRAMQVTCVRAKRTETERERQAQRVCRCCDVVRTCVRLIFTDC